MRVALATLCLNEMEWLPKLWEQHRNWPDRVHWVFVESADRVYGQCNPHLVTEEGLSVDGTTAFLRELSSKRSHCVTHIPYGWCSHTDPAQGKVEARQQYINVLRDYDPDMLVVVDGDEFYCYSDQQRINKTFLNQRSMYSAILFRQRHVWKPPSVKYKLFTKEAIKGYWGVPHCRVWRWQDGVRYSKNHNWLEDDQGFLTRNMLRYHIYQHTPQCVHMGYASSLVNRAAKHLYYKTRGEGVDDGRQMYVDCRNAFENYVQGVPLPHGAKVIPYSGPIPEVFQ